MFLIEHMTLASEKLAEAVEGLLGELSDKEYKFSENDMKSIVESENGNLFLVFDHDVAVGMGCVSFLTTPTGKKAVIDDVVLTESVRGRGLSKLLIISLLEFAKQNGAKSVSLTSNPNRVAANALYRKCGFQLRDTNVYVLNF